MDLQGHRNLDTEFTQGLRDACAWWSPVSIAKLHTQLKTQALENYKQLVRIRLRHIRNCNPTPLPTPGAILKLQTPKINTCCMLDFQTSSTTLSSAHQAEFFIISRRVVFDFPIHSQSSLATWHWFHTRSEALLLTAVSTGFSISSSSEDNVASAILFTHSPQATPTSFPGLFPSRGRHPSHEKAKALGTRLRLPKPNYCN